MTQDKRNSNGPWSEEKLRENRRWLSAYVLSTVGDRNAAEDIIQEVFKIAWEKRDRFTEGTNFGGWLREIAKRVVLRYFRRKKSRTTLVEDENIMTYLDKTAQEHEKEMKDEEQRTMMITALKECIRELSGKLMKMIQMKYFNGSSSAEIASTLDLSENSVNVGSYKARNKLLECMKRKM